jgi:2-iminobutanoate/2-iminopropanoate deaminase
MNSTLRNIAILPLLVALVTLLGAGCMHAGQPHGGNDFRYLNPDDLPKPPPIFSQVVSGPRHGTPVYISGQVAFDRGGQIVGAGDMAKQMDQSFANLRGAITAAGGRPEHVTRLMVFIVDLRPEHLKSLFAAIRASFPADRMPANTLLGVSRLARDGLLFEVQADMVVP